MKKISKRKTAGIVLLSIIGMIFAILAGVFAYYKLCMDPHRGTVQEFSDSCSMDELLSGKEAKEDLKYVIEHLQERHPAWLDGSDELMAAAEAQYEKEAAGIGKEISVLELCRAASRITAKLHDGHTYIKWNNDAQERYIDDFTQLRTYGNPVAVDGVPVDEIFDTYREMASYELEFYAERLFFGSAIVREQSLDMCGIDTSDGVVITFEKDGGQEEYTYQFVPLEEVKGFEQGGEDTPWVFWQIDKENSVGIFTLTACVYNEEYKRTLDEFFSEVFAENIRNVVVDLRGNSGGNSWVANAFMTYLNVDKYASWDCAVRYGWYLLENKDIEYINQKKEQVFDGEVYVLTDNWTYSAAMDFAMLIGDNGIGTIVGEPSGNLPDSYGDCLYFQLPNSGLMMSVSHKKWYRVDKTRSGEPLMPDYEVAADKALEKVYELIR